MTLEKARERFGRMTLRDMETASGAISLMATRRGVNIANRGRDSANSVSHVTKKWKDANVSCASLRVGSVKIALFVKTCRVRVSIKFVLSFLVGRMKNHLQCQ